MPTPQEGLTPPGRATGRAGRAQTNAAQANTEQANIEQANTEQANTEQANTEQANAAAANAAAANTAPANTVLADDLARLTALTLHEKVLLLTGADSWSTQGADALGLRPMIMSDGPAGARGVTLDERLPSTSLPCPSALGATWDPSLVRDLAQALGAEARSKGIDVLLGPTINLMRTPLGGRGFEFFSEDPVLTASIAVAFVRGLQGAGVAATVKHYAGNDTETQRWSYDARIAENVLRELYLVPFEACVRDADAALVMAAYNKVNGIAMTENARLLRDVLKAEWGFRGVVTSDWHAARSTTATALATLDLSMPGPHGPWGDLLAEAVAAGVVTEEVLEDKLVRLLGLARRVGALRAAGDRAEQAAANGGPAGQPAAPHAVRLVDPALLRRATAASLVLLSNTRGVLPLREQDLASLAVIGPGAVRPVIQGGGSAIVAPGVISTPADALTRRLAGQAEVTVQEGCPIWGTVPEPAPGTLRDPVTGGPGARLEFLRAGGSVLGSEHRASTSLVWWDGVPPGVGWGEAGVIALSTLYRAGTGGPHLLGAAGVGHLRITVDGELVADRATVVPDDPVQAMTRPGQVRVGLDLQEDREVLVRIEFRPAADGEGPLAVRLGIVPARDEESMLADAESAAARAGAAVVVVGSAELTESEGFDRPGLALPGRQDELVRRVAAVNPRTVVVINSGMPVLMPWADEAAAVLQAWLPGQAMGDALAAVLLGDAEPGGRLPVTLPAAEADCPVLHAAPEDGVLEYREGLLIGYRGYDATGIAPRFAFGHGLGYTSWAYEAVSAWAGDHVPGRDLRVRVTVRNTGDRPGREIVQAYLAGPPGEAAGRPVRVLAAFGAAVAAPGQAAEVSLHIPARLFARWDEAAGGWTWPQGPFTVHVGRSSADLRLSLVV